MVYGKKTELNKIIQSRKPVYTSNTNDTSVDTPLVPPRLCSADYHLCQYGNQVKAIVRTRGRFTDALRKHTVSIFIHDGVKTWWGTPPWLSEQGLGQCPQWSCSVTHDANLADVVVHNLRAPQDTRKDQVHAILNFEAHSYDPRREDTNLVLISYHQESDMVSTYSYSIMHALGLCVGDVGGTRPDGRKCENMIDLQSPFWHWCAQTYQGDFFSCVFNVVPHIASTNLVNRSADALGVMWVSATCERHGGYLAELMKHMAIDSMGGCYRNRNEMEHPALQAKDMDGIWWGTSADPPLDTKGNRKIMIASHYKFFISVENTILDDYVTEKFYEGLLTDSVMVYLGAPNARTYAPSPRAFISALDFESPKALAAFLIDLAADTDRYHSFSSWRREQPVRLAPSFVQSMRRDIHRLDNESMLCRLCNAVRDPSFVPEKQVAIIVPTRERDEQWAVFQEHMCSFWKSNTVPLHIWRIEQTPERSFNRAWLFNVGLKLHQNHTNPNASVSCVAVHDVDLIPEPGVDYTDCSMPTQLGSELEHFNWGYPYEQSMGGVFLASASHWTQVNGMSNSFWGWGGEDDELFERFKRKGLLIDGQRPRRPAKGFGRFRKIKQGHNVRAKVPEEYKQNVAILTQAQRNMLDPADDGLSQTTYALKSTTSHACNNSARVTVHTATVAFFK